MQALAAACKTVDCLKIIHSLHAYFLLLGDFNSTYPCLFNILNILNISTFIANSEFCHAYVCSVISFKIRL